MKVVQWLLKVITIIWSWAVALGQWTWESIDTMIRSTVMALITYNPFKRRIAVREFDLIRPTVLGILIFCVSLGFVGAIAAVMFKVLWLSILGWGSMGVAYFVIDHQFEVIETAFADALPTERYIKLGRVLWLTVYREYRMMDVVFHVNDFEKNEVGFKITIKGVE